MLSKKILILFAVIVLTIIAAGVWLGFKFLGSESPEGASQYSAVYLVTGDIYYGKLSFFPRMKLRDVWFLQRGVDPQTQQQQFGLAKLTTAFWGPVDKVYLNPDQVLFWTALRNDSQVAQAFKNPESLRQLNQQGAPGLPQQGEGGSQGFQGPTGPPPNSESSE